MKYNLGDLPLFVWCMLTLALKKNPQVYITREGIEEINNKPQVYTTREGIEEIKNNPQVYTTQEGIE